MSEILVVALVMLATHRLTHLVVADRITRYPREWLQLRAERRWFERHPGASDGDEWRSWLGYMLSCPWCVSPWVGGAVTLGSMWTVGLPAPLLVWLAASSVTGLLASKE